MLAERLLRSIAAISTSDVLDDDELFVDSFRTDDPERLTSVELTNRLRFDGIGFSSNRKQIELLKNIQLNKAVANHFDCLKTVN